jgi:hypothetical protein
MHLCRDAQQAYIQFSGLLVEIKNRLILAATAQSCMSIKAQGHS